MKYIITHNNSPIIFSEAEVHSEVAREVGGAKSAGFVQISYLNKTLTLGEPRFLASTYGTSISLKLTPDPKDAEKIERMFNN